MNTVLIADDSFFMRALIRRSLEEEGYRVVGEAENGTVCIKKFAECRPEIVTLDITMPEMNGIQTLTALMKMNPNVKVIMVSALGQEAIIKEAIAIGAKSFIVKPFKQDYFISVLNKIAAG